MTHSDCPVCKDTFVDPHILECGHSICMSCANELYSLQILKRKIQTEFPSTLLKRERKNREEKEKALKEEEERKQNEQKEKPEEQQRTNESDAKMDTNGDDHHENREKLDTNEQNGANEEPIQPKDDKADEEKMEEIEEAPKIEEIPKPAQEEKRYAPTGECLEIRCPVCDVPTSLSIDIPAQAQLKVDEQLTKDVEVLKRSRTYF
jgi:archaellum component FlaD/FlaE